MTAQQSGWRISRVLVEEGTGARVVVSLGAPEVVAAQEWRCRVAIEGAGLDQERDVYGLDPFQALVVAIEGIHMILAGSGRSLTWEGGEPGDAGFPRVVPQALGPGVAREIDGLVDEVVARFTEMARRRAEGGGAGSRG